MVAAEDLEAGTRRPKFQTEPTLPLYLKVRNSASRARSFSFIHLFSATARTVLNPGFVDMHGLMLYYVFGQAKMEIDLATTPPIETWLAIAWSGSVLYRVSSYMIFMYKTLPSFQQ